METDLPGVKFGVSAAAFSNEDDSELNGTEVKVTVLLANARFVGVQGRWVNHLHCCPAGRHFVPALRPPCNSQPSMQPSPFQLFSPCALVAPTPATAPAPPCASWNRSCPSPTLPCPLHLVDTPRAAGRPHQNDTPLLATHPSLPSCQQDDPPPLALVPTRPISGCRRHHLHRRRPADCPY